MPRLRRPLAHMSNLMFSQRPHHYVDPNLCTECGTRLDSDDGGSWCPKCEGFEAKCEACGDGASDLVDRGGLWVCAVPCNAEDRLLEAGA